MSDSLKTLDKAFTVLWALVYAGRPTGPVELARSLEMDKASVLRILKSFEHYGLVRREPPGRYEILSESFRAIADAAPWRADIYAVAKPVLQRLARETGQTCILTLLAGDRAFCAEKAESPAAVGIIYQVGRQAPLYAGSSARVILAFLPPAEQQRYLATASLKPLTPSTLVDPAALRAACEQTRQQGYSLSVGEVDPGVAALAAPVFQAGRVIGSVSLVSFPDRFAGEALAPLARAVTGAAAGLSLQLGGP